VRVGLALWFLVVAVAHALAQPGDSPPRDTGYIGRPLPRLEIDDCRQLDPALTPEQLSDIGSEHYQRGETLYIQGDYEGAVNELVAAYCLIPYYTILKDIGQAYERSLEYEKAIAYLERYIAAVPPDATRADPCKPDPQEDKVNVARRVMVLRNLQAKIFVETTPADARITLSSDAGIASRARSRQEISVLGGRYEMLVEHDGYEPYTQEIEVKIGRPYTYYVRLEPQKGTLSVQVTPADARIFVGDRLVGIGRYEETVASGRYQLSFEAPGRVRAVREVEVLPGKRSRELVELSPVPQSGRRTMIVASTIGGAVAGGGLLGASNRGTVATAGFVLGGAGGLVGAYMLAPDAIPLAPTNLVVTAGAAGGIAGFAAASTFTERANIQQPLLGAGVLLGAVSGYYVGDRFAVSVGDAALFNSAVLWGTTAGVLFRTSFDPPSNVGAGLVLSGLGMGTIGGVMLARYFEISRTHAALIDVGGVIGMVSGLAVKGVAYPNTEDDANTERLANFALGGLAVGLLGAAILTRNLDAPKMPVQPTLGTATAPDGSQAPTFGVVGAW
jgi:hypothetical protein